MADTQSWITSPLLALLATIFVIIFLREFNGHGKMENETFSETSVDTNQLILTLKQSLKQAMALQNHTFNDTSKKNDIFINALLNNNKGNFLKAEKYNNSDNFYLDFCFALPDWKLGLGNKLEQYWYGRALAFWFNLDFVLRENCTCTIFENYFCKQHFGYFSEWTQFLPHKSNLTIRQLYKSLQQNTLEKTYETIWLNTLNEMNQKNITKVNKSLKLNLLDMYNNWDLQSFTQTLKKRRKDNSGNTFEYYNGLLIYLYSEKWATQLPIDSKVFLSVLNKLFIQIIRNEMNLAYYLYFEQRHINNGIMNEYQFVYNLIHRTENRVNNKYLSIHYRCGGKVQRNSVHFIGLKWYKDAIKLLHLYNNNNVNLTVFFLIQLDKTKAREVDLPYIDACNQIMDILEPYFKNLTSVINNFIIVPNGTVVTDSYFLSHSDYILGEQSTFYRTMLLGNRGNGKDKNIVVPVIGNYFKENKIFKNIVPDNIIHLPEDNYKFYNFEKKGKSPNHSMIYEMTQFLINH